MGPKGSRAALLFIGLKSSPWRWTAAGGYVLYGIGGALWIIIFLCPYCHYYHTRFCPCGYGWIASKLRGNEDDALFRAKFRKHIPVIVPLWVIPAE